VKLARRAFPILCTQALRAIGPRQAVRLRGTRLEATRAEMPPTLPPGLSDLIAARFPRGTIVEAQALLPDSARGADAKAVGYGCPYRIVVRDEGNRRWNLVFRTATANDFGHDRRSDRAEEALLAYDTFHLIPRSARMLDVGALTADGKLLSLEGSGEFYLLTEYVEGTPYADDLRRVASKGLSSVDELRCDALANYLSVLHAQHIEGDAGYRRAIRDLLGHGEGIFGIVDGYPPDTPAAPAERLQRIEQSCLDWRWRLRRRTRRLARTHGDFHPFNIVFREGADFSLLDASRGSQGDPADDVTAMAMNYVFFAVDHPGAWRRGLGILWRRFWTTYLSKTDDEDLLEVVAPFLAWRGLVVACPRFYPGLSPRGRDLVLGFIERTLAADRFEPASAEELFR
jgi:hypothetical protein